MLYLLALGFTIVVSTIIPNYGTGSESALNADPSATCSLSSATPGECTVQCSDDSRVLLEVTSGESTYTEYYDCKITPSGFSVDMSTLYSSKPYNLTVTGQNFFASEVAKCRLDSYEMDGEVLDASTMTCKYITAPTGTYQLGISLNGIDWLQETVSITVAKTPRVTGPEKTTFYSEVKILGNHLSDSLSCRVNGIKYSFSSTNTCNLASLEGSHSLEIIDSQDMVLSPEYSITVLPDLDIKGIHLDPVASSRFSVLISGEINGDVNCKISDSSALAVLQTDGSVLCEFSSLSDGSHSLSLTDSEGNTISDTAIVTKISTIDASYFIKDNYDVEVVLTQIISPVYCKWGENPRLEMTLLSESGFLYLCETSAINDFGSRTVSLSINGVDFIDTYETLLTKYRNAVITGIQPTELLKQGGTIQLTSSYHVTGPDYEFQVEKNGLVLVARTDVTASSSELSCVIPSISTTGEVLLKVYQDSVEIASLDLLIADLLTISEVVPDILVQSGTKVAVNGAGFFEVLNDSSLNKCRWTVDSQVFETDLTFVSNTQIECNSPSITSSDVNLQLFNLDSSLSANYTLTVSQIPTINSIETSTIIEGTPTSMFVKGATFIESVYLRAQITTDAGELIQEIEPTFFSSELVYFNLTFTDRDPNIHPNLKIQVSNNADAYSDGFQVSLKPTPAMVYMSYIEGPFLGGYVLSIHGNGFTTGVSCKFGEYESAATVVSYNEITCTVPYNEPGEIQVTLLLDNREFFRITQNLMYLDDLDYTIEPNIGPEEGDTIVTVQGDFSRLTSYPVKCYFGSSEALESSFDNGNILCKSPAGTGQVQVSLVINGLSYITKNPNVFSYVKLTDITNVSIDKGPSRGDTWLYISVQEISTDCCWSCDFDGTFTDAQYIDGTTLLCKTPSHVYSDSVTIGWTNNQQQSKDSSFQFSYYQDMQIRSADKEIGRREGNTRIVFTGHALSSVTHCMFDSTVVTVNVLTSETVECVSPVNWNQGQVLVTISGNEQDFTISGVQFEYLEDIQLVGITPRLNPKTNPTSISISLNSPADGLFCKINNIVQQTTKIDDHTAVCQFTQSYTSDQQTLYLSYDNQNYVQFDSLSVIELYDDVTIQNISPRQGNTGTRIEISLSQKIDAVDFVCRIDGVDMDWSYYANPICYIPEISKGTHVVSISFNSQDFLDAASFSFTFNSPVQVTLADPHYVLINSNSEITVKGFSFVGVHESHLACQFRMSYNQEDEVNGDKHIVQATFEDSETIKCTLPSTEWAGTSQVRVTSDELIFSDTFVNVEIIDSCKDRMDCTTGKIKSCPLGYYCPIESWYKNIPCPKGYYQDEHSQPYCKPCTLGFYCPNRAQATPTVCSSSHACAEYALSSIIDLCPLGYVCNDSTKSLHFLSMGGSELEFCPEGFYCRYGVSFTCAEGFYCPKYSKAFFGMATCPPGFYCTGGSDVDVHPCPPRHYCPGSGNSFAIPCPIGSYNPFLAQSSCEECPLGSICPYEGLFLPQPCPRGYVCNVKGLAYPETLCTAGYYCELSVQTPYVERPCQLLGADGSDFCDITSVELEVTLPEFGSEEEVLCCWNTEKLVSFVENISSDFRSAAEEMGLDELNGMHLYTFDFSSQARRLQETAPSASTYFDSDEDIALFKLHVKQATDLLQPTICPGAVFCLDGVGSSEASDSIRTPYICNPGTYCESGSSTSQGSGLCPKGFYCPEGTEDPIPTDQGKVTSFLGNDDQVSCPQGSFSYIIQATECVECPSGYQCDQSTKIWPRICSGGNYRNVFASNFCIECIIGSWNYDLGMIGKIDCFGCAPGRVCSFAGIYNISQSSNCPQGEVCPEGSPATRRLACQPGFVCGDGTTPTNQYDNLCEKGFYCAEGTTERDEFLLLCPTDAYCPPGTYDYLQFAPEQTGLDFTSEEYPPTMCPDGTGGQERTGREELLECTRKPGFRDASYLRVIDPIDQALINSTVNVREHNHTIFYLQSREIALITIDFRHLGLANSLLEYGIDWALSYSIIPQEGNTTSVDINPVPMPQIFLNDLTTKNGVHEFTIMGWSPVAFRVDVLIYNGIFSSYLNLFLNTVSVEMFTPNRANFGTINTFLAVIDDTLALPYNIPTYNSDLSMPPYLLSYGRSPHRASFIRHEQITNENWFLPNSLYWDGRTELALPYFPYFSNCQGWGDYIPIWAILELSKECTDVSPEDVVVVGDYDFGLSPTADFCEGIKTTCVLDEVPEESQPVPRWFEQELEGTVFHISRQAIDPEAFMAGEYGSELIPVLMMTPPGGSSFPGTITMDIFYYQADKETKEIIEVLISFSDLKELSALQFSGDETVEYDLVINYRALSHKELLIRFVFDISFYAVLNLLIGTISIFMGLLFVIYHRVFTQEKKPQPFKFWSFIVMMIPESIKGVTYGILPILTVLIFTSILVMGRLFNNIFPITGESVEGKIGLFDNEPATYSETEQLDPVVVRMGRTGVCLMVTGVYLLMFGAVIFIPNEDQQPEDETGNVWHFVTWKRGNFLFLAFVLIMGCELLIFFSYSEFFGVNIWYMLVGILILGIIWDYFAAVVLNDNLLLSPFTQAVGVTGGLVTFGASTFFDFLQAYFVEFAMMILGRLYLDFIAGFVTEKLEGLSEKVKFTLGFISDKIVALGNKEKNNKVSDEPSLEKEKLIENDKDSLEEDWEPPHFDEPLENSYYTVEQVERTPRESLHDPADAPPPEQDLEPLLESYQSYANDLFVLIYSPLFIGILWNYYDAVLIVANYGIAREDFLLYFLFSLMIAPFQVVIDIFLHNCNQHFNGWVLHDFLDYMGIKFKERKHRWAGYDCTDDTNIEDKSRGLFRMSFSSQFYFMSTIYCSGILLCLLGLDAIISQPDYNIFNDRGIYGLVIFQFTLCVVVHLGYKLLGNLLKIWNIPVKVEPEGSAYLSSDQMMIDDEELDEIEDLEEEERIERLHKELGIFISRSDDLMVPQIKNWNEVEIVKANDEVIRRELQTDRIEDPETREKFIEINEAWIQHNIEGILTPRTLEEQRGSLLSVCEKMFGELDYSPSATSRSDHLETPPEYEFSGSVVAVANHWLGAARHLRHLRSQIAGLLQIRKENNCAYCWTKFKLQCEILEGVEEMHRRFLQTQDTNWIEFVNRHAHFRTLCSDCYRMCENFHIYSAINRQNFVYNIQDVKKKIPKSAKAVAQFWLSRVRNK